MPKGKRQSRNPVEKLQSSISQLNNIFLSILDSADKPDFMTTLVAFKKSMTDLDSKKSKPNSDALEIIKLLQTYPGLSKQILSYLKFRISEYKALNVLDKYKSEEVVAPKKRKKESATPAAKEITTETKD